MEADGLKIRWYARGDLGLVLWSRDMLVVMISSVTSWAVVEIKYEIQIQV